MKALGEIRAFAVLHCCRLLKSLIKLHLYRINLCSIFRCIITLTKTSPHLVVGGAQGHPLHHGARPPEDGVVPMRLQQNFRHHVSAVAQVHTGVVRVVGVAVQQECVDRGVNCRGGDLSTLLHRFPPDLQCGHPRPSSILCRSRRRSTSPP